MDIYKYFINPQMQLTKLKMEYWLNHTVFTVFWWLDILVIIVSWLLWLKFSDKARLKELLLYGFFVIFIASSLDNIGMQLGLWYYSYMLFPFSNIFEPYDFAFLPVVYMLIFQRFSRWRTFIAVQIICSFIFSFILEPVTEHYNIYLMLNWSTLYSFFIYPLLGIVCKALTDLLNRHYWDNLN